jgi:hypothetical protein
MPCLIGVDEAGYGPNLGPLVISASVWRVAEGVHADDLYEQLAPAVAPPPVGAGDGRVPIGDSKQIYKPKQGLARLELGVLAALGVCDLWNTATANLGTWRTIWERLDPQAWPQMAKLPWYQDYDTPLPYQAESTQLDACQKLLRRHTAQPPVELITVRSRAIFPQRFNQLVDRAGNKSTVLSQVSLGLVAELLDEFPSERAHVLCDKHGGRNRYGALIQEAFGDLLVQVRREGREESTYRLNSADRQIEFRFQAKGDRCLPPALASMSSKYLRELAMQAFNAFWCQQLPTLQPTAGYPVDARRFLDQSAPVQQRLKITPAMFWRQR